MARGASCLLVGQRQHQVVLQAVGVYQGDRDIGGPPAVRRLHVDAVEAVLRDVRLGVVSGELVGGHVGLHLDAEARVRVVPPAVHESLRI